MTLAQCGKTARAMTKQRCLDAYAPNSGNASDLTCKRAVKKCQDMGATPDQIKAAAAQDVQNQVGRNCDRYGKNIFSQDFGSGKSTSSQIFRPNREEFHQIWFREKSNKGGDCEDKIREGALCPWQGGQIESDRKS